MKLKPILCSMAAFSLMAGMTSCHNEEDVVMPVDKSIGVDLSNCEKVKMLIQTPGNEMRTRAGEDPDFSYGDDGLLSFSRTIDKLWYAVYNNGTLLYHSFQPGITQANYDATTKGFTLDIMIPRVNEQIKLEEYSVFFFAGNANDKVENREISDGIGLDFANKTMYAYPAVLNKTIASGEMFNPQQYDFFAKYITLDKVVDAEYNGNVTLIRPFCQVSLLTDELCKPAILSAYATDCKVAVNTVPSIFSRKNTSAGETLPYGWNYGTDAVLLKDLSQLSFTLNSRAFNNSTNSYSIPQEVTFKNRKMFCVATYLMLAPYDRNSYNPGSSEEKFYFNLTVGGDRNSTTAFASAKIPSAGLKANEKYVMYNKKYNEATGGYGDPDDPDDPDDGDDPRDPNNPDDDGPGGLGGILSNHYFIDVLVDPAWNGNNNIIY